MKLQRNSFRFLFCIFFFFSSSLGNDKKFIEKLNNLLEYAPLADVPDVLPSSLFFPVIMFKLPKLPFDLLIGNFSFTSGGLTSPSKLPAVLPYIRLHMSFLPA